MALTILNHPLASDIMAQLRDASTPPDSFRALCYRLTTMLILEATTGLRSEPSTVTTPLEDTPCHRIAQGIAAIPILRAGLGMLQPVLDVFEDVSVGHIGLERSHETAIASSYFAKLPPLGEKLTLCLDPMLATGGSASQALSVLRAAGAVDLVMVSLVSAPEGVELLKRDHPGVRVVTAALDRELNSQKYILPGLGDFGDRLYGTF